MVINVKSNFYLTPFLFTVTFVFLNLLTILVIRLPLHMDLFCVMIEVSATCLSEHFKWCLVQQKAGIYITSFWPIKRLNSYYTSGRTHATFDITCIPACVGASDVISNYLLQRCICSRRCFTSPGAIPPAGAARVRSEGQWAVRVRRGRVHGGREADRWRSRWEHQADPGQPSPPCPHHMGLPCTGTLCLTYIKDTSLCNNRNKVCAFCAQPIFFIKIII